MTEPAAPAATETEPETEHTITGDVRTHEGFHSRYLEHDRTVVVYLPPGYDEASATRYPVLYLHDGQNVFDRATSVGDEWRVDETAQELISRGEIEPIIIVGIYNTGEHRIDEYAPTPLPDKGGGHADDYGRMLVEELKPFIDATYNTLPSAASTALGGSSLGGLLTVHLGLRFPTAFNKLAVLSPSVWWDDRVIVREVEAVPHKLPLRIWLDAGTAEGDESVIPDARALRDALVAKGWQEGLDLAYLEAAGGRHDEGSWAERVSDVLKFLFPPKPAAGAAHAS
jgi:predicted alpha/beta superfamily hydrolase